MKFLLQFLDLTNLSCCKLLQLTDSSHLALEQFHPLSFTLFSLSCLSVFPKPYENLIKMKLLMNQTIRCILILSLNTHMPIGKRSNSSRILQVTKQWKFVYGKLNPESDSLFALCAEVLHM